MQVWDDTKGVVDPVAIARHNTRFKGDLGARLPLVVRPSLITDQFRGLRGNGGCGCGGGCGGGDLGAYNSAIPGLDGGGQYIYPGMDGTPPGMDQYIYAKDRLDGLRGLGQLDPGSLALEINTMVASARAFWNSLVQALGIRAGAREADVITPVQDKITSTILAPAVQMGSNPQNFSCTDMRKMLGVVQQAKIEFKAFLTNTTWQDGRAARQALVWLEGPLPASTSGAWFNQVLTDYSGDVSEKCGTGGGGAIPPGGQVTGSASILPLILGALFILPKLR